MSNIQITKIEMPKGQNFGILQINNLVRTHFRFDIKNGKPVLDTSFFVDNKEPDERHQVLQRDSKLYIDVKEALEKYLIPHNELFKEKQAIVNERNHLLDQLRNFNDLMQSAVNELDFEKFEKMERDFRHVAERLDFLGKRTNEPDRA